MNDDDDGLNKSVLLPCDQERAFSLFTDHIGEWWPPERRHLKDVQSILVLTQEQFSEHGDDGRRVELGRVVDWEPPRRIVLDFYPGTDSAHPTAVVIQFVTEGEATRVLVEHRWGRASPELWGARVSAFRTSWEVVLAALLTASAV